MNQHPYPVPDPRNPGAPPSLVFFEEEAMPNPAESQKAGVPMFDTVVVAKVLVPGQSKSEVKYEVLRQRPDGSEKLSNQGRFGDALRLWQQKRVPQMSGTPLSEVPWLDRSMVETFRHQNIFTLQQLAELSDQLVTAIPRGMHWRAKAKALLEEGLSGAVVAKQAEEIETLKSEVGELRTMLKDALKKSQGFDKPKAKPGRKPKAQPAEESETA